jgi:hypothetical protein
MWRLGAIASFKKERLAEGGLFFTLLFAPLLLIMMGFVFGNAPDPLFGGRGQLDVNVPAHTALTFAQRAPERGEQ